MKRTDIERWERERKRQEKRLLLDAKREMSYDNKTEGAFIKNLALLFKHDEEKIYNIAVDEQILELLYDMRDHLDAKSWDNVFKKAIKRTKITQKEEALKELRELIT